MAVKLNPSLVPTYNLLTRSIRNDFTFVTGPPSTGKTTLVKWVFEREFEDIYLAAYVDCFSMPSQTRLFSTICQAYSSTLNISIARVLNRTGTRQTVDHDNLVSLADFPRYLDEYYRLAKSKGYLKLYIILDHVEVFEKTNLMDSFVALCRTVTQGLYELRLVIISYESPCDIIQYVTQKSIPIGICMQDKMQVIHCGVWSKDDIVDWILRLPPKIEELHDLYKRFVKNIVPLVYMSDTKDARQVRMYCQQNFPDFIEYQKIKTKEQIRKLLKLNPDEALDDEVLNEYSLGDSHNTALVQSFLSTHRNIADKRKPNFRWSHKDTEIKMPINTCTMIVAAYLAAYTKPSDDKRNFVTSRNRKTGSRTSTKNHSVNRPFTLERLMQLYIRLMQRAVGSRDLHILYNNDCALADVERLENLNILQHQGGYELSSESRYKLSPNIKRAYVQRLAKHNDLSLDWFEGLSIE